MLDLTDAQHQKLILLTGSKKGWAIYLGLVSKEADRLWKLHGLKPPTDWFRSLTRTEQLELLAEQGSYTALAKQVGCSATALRTVMTSRKPDRAFTEDELIALVETAKSVAFAARLADVSESNVRREADRLGIELAPLLDYSFGGNSNAKGRRAELEYAAMRPGKILRDLNLDEGSQADYDFDDADHGRVNVKSSRQYRYIASTRKDEPDFWKISLRSKEKADFFVAMCYDPKMQKLVGYRLIKTVDLPETMTLTLLRRDLTMS